MEPFEVRVLTDKAAPLSLASTAGIRCWPDSAQSAVQKGLKSDSVLLGAYYGGTLVAISIWIFQTGDPLSCTTGANVVDEKQPKNVRLAACLSELLWVNEEMVRRGVSVCRCTVPSEPGLSLFHEVLEMIPSCKVANLASSGPPAWGARWEGDVSGEIRELIAGL